MPTLMPSALTEHTPTVGVLVPNPTGQQLQFPEESSHGLPDPTAHSGFSAREGRSGPRAPGSGLTAGHAVSLADARTDLTRSHLTHPENPANKSALLWCVVTFRQNKLREAQTILRKYGQESRMGGPE